MWYAHKSLDQYSLTEQSIEALISQVIACCVTIKTLEGHKRDSKEN